MVITNRQAAEKFGINFAKWKRWSREFLPPDPSAGMQRGVTRQYSPEEAFTVYLGGYLVSDLRISVSEAKAVLKDLLPDWLEKHDIFPLRNMTEVLEGSRRLPSWSINILRSAERFVYQAKGHIETIPLDKAQFKDLYRCDGNIYEQRYIEEDFGPYGVVIDPEKLVGILPITTLAFRFLGELR